MDTSKINHLSLCSGYGGIDIGLRRVLPNVRTVAYVEIEAFAAGNLVAKMESKQLDAAPIWTNLKTFDARPFRGQVDILSGGFPCQPFSHAGQRKGTDDPRHLFPDIERIILECEPRIIFLENVEGIISSKLGGEPDTSVLKHVLERLEALGYRATASIFSAEEVGAPHRRKRVFILAVSDTDSEYRGRGKECKQHTRKNAGQPTQECCGELGNTRCNNEGARGKHQDSSQGSGEWDAEQGGSGCNGGERYWSTTGRIEGVGNSTGNGCDKGEPDKNAGSKKRSGEEGRLQESSGGCCKLGNTTGAGLERHSRGVSGEEEPTREGEGNERNTPFRSIFPSRPTEPQQPWEAPRTIGETEEVIIALGGATHGFANGDMVRSCRIDSLRLLGNGVVPATAERAFVCLMEKLR